MKINQLILGSTSSFRAQVLKDAGIQYFEQMGSEFDEESIQGFPPKELALKRSNLKGLGVPAPAESLIISGDQVLEFEGQDFGKAANIDEARQRLKSFRGKTHYLHSAFSLIYVSSDQSKTILKSRVVTAEMKMAACSDAQVEAYLATNEWVGCAGCYQFENKGVHLFERVIGHTTGIIGLPMPELLSELRELGVDLLVQRKGPWVVVNH